MISKSEKKGRGEICLNFVKEKLIYVVVFVDILSLYYSARNVHYSARGSMTAIFIHERALIFLANSISIKSFAFVLN